MFVPYSTDAPLYHFPTATIGLIVLNIALFLGVPAEYVRPVATGVVPAGQNAAQAVADAGGKLQVEYPSNTLALQRGSGLKPWQWLTNGHLHTNFIQLIFNMIFLWAFGLVVEGKVGSLIFLGLYIGIGTIHSAIEQTLFCFWGSGASVGAAAAIYGILGIALVWAPQNEFEVAWFFGWAGAGSFSIPILMFAFIRFAFDFIGVAFTGLFGSDAFQILGLGLGIAAGFVWLKRGWVDCEGWDLVTVWQGKEGKVEEREDINAEASALIRESTKRLKENKAQKKRKKSRLALPKNSPNSPPRSQSPETPQGELAEQPAARNTVKPEDDIEQLILDGQLATAIKLYEKHKRSGTQLELKQGVLFESIKGLLSEEKYEAALPCIEEHVKRFKHGQIPLLLNMAKVLLHLELPRKAQRPLKSLQSLNMDENEKAQWTELAQASRRQIADGAIEFSD